MSSDRNSKPLPNKPPNHGVVAVTTRTPPQTPTPIQRDTKPSNLSSDPTASASNRAAGGAHRRHGSMNSLGVGRPAPESSGHDHSQSTPQSSHRRAASSSANISINNENHSSDPSFASVSRSSSTKKTKRLSGIAEGLAQAMALPSTAPLQVRKTNDTPSTPRPSSPAARKHGYTDKRPSHLNLSQAKQSSASSVVVHPGNSPKPTPRPTPLSPSAIPESASTASTEEWNIVVDSPSGFPDAGAGARPPPSKKEFDAIALVVDTGKVFEAYHSLRSALESNELSKVNRLGSIYLTEVRGRLKQLKRIPDTVSSSALVISARENVDFHHRLFASFIDRPRVDLVGAERTQVIDFAMDMVDMIWTSLKSLLATVEQECLYYILDPQLFKDNRGIESEPADARAQLERMSRLIALSNEQSPSSVSTVLKALQTYLKKLSRPQVRRPGIADGATTGGSTTMATGTMRAPATKLETDEVPQLPSEVTAEVLSGETVGAIRLALRASLVVCSTVTVSHALEFPRSEAERTEVIRDQNYNAVAASLTQWVRILTDSIEVEESTYAELLDTFFLFFRFFTTPDDLFAALMDRYHQAPPPNLSAEQTRSWQRYHRHAKLLVVKMMTWWLQWYWVEKKDGHLRDAFINFTFKTLAMDKVFLSELAATLAVLLCRIAPGRLGPYSRRLQDHIERGEHDGQTLSPTAFQDEMRNMRALVAEGRRLTLVDVLLFRQNGGAEELARALTKIESDLFHGFLPEDIATFRDKDVSEKLKDWDTFINSLPPWIASSILAHRTVHKRAEAFELFIQVAVCCMKLRNYSTAHSIMTTLELSPLRRLKQTADLVSPEHRAMFKDLVQFFNDPPAYRKYHDALQEAANAPAVPLIFVLKADVVRIHDQSKLRPRHACDLSEVKSKNLIDLSYYRNIRRLVRDLEQCYGEYKFPHSDIIHQWIEACRKPYIGLKYETYLDKLFKDSVALEPPESGAVARHKSWIEEADFDRAKKFGYQV
ncbi:ras GEF [Panus rudis PR-1116 ss-1]|nr:ras GEF [Panus rudis PR-1116 ss-1]